MSKYDSGWIGVDLDGTLAHYDHFRGLDHIGSPIYTMVNRVKTWLAKGIEVRIFTARIGSPHDVKVAKTHIRIWLFNNGLPELANDDSITCTKDLHMIELWDDRCIAIEKNTGKLLSPNPRNL